MKLRLRGLALVATLLAVSAPLRAQDAAALFHEAYFLEKEQGQLEPALALYQRALASPARARSCRPRSRRTSRR
jgi:hypothetical protein